MAKKKHRKKRAKSAADCFGGERTDPIGNTNRSRNGDSIIEEIEGGDRTNTSNRKDLLEELSISNLTIDTITIVFFATLLNLYYESSLKAKTLDKLFNTNFTDNFIDTTNFPRITNTIFLYTSGVFLILKYTLLQESKYKHRNDWNNKEVVSAWKAFLSSLLVFLSVVISRDNIEL